jgi:hypothetical protein
LLFAIVLDPGSADAMDDHLEAGLLPAAPADLGHQTGLFPCRSTSGEAGDFHRPRSEGQARLKLSQTGVHCGKIVGEPGRGGDADDCAGHAPHGDVSRRPSSSLGQ